MLRWLELTADYRCNNRCVGCHSVSDAGASMSSAEALAALRRAYLEGARSLWLGGGEPTLRRDLFALVSAARRLGYTRVKLQTNGMLLAYEDFARRCAAAGVTEVNVALKGATADTHDRLTRTPGCHALLLAAIAHVRALGLPLQGDVLVYKSNAHEIPAIVRSYFALGVESFQLWLLSPGPEDPAAQEEAPRIADVMPHLVAAMDLALSPRRDFIVSLHTPPCTVPRTHHGCLFHAAELALVVENPGGHRFRLERSAMEGGAFLPRCGGCPSRPRCDGPRSDYLARFGDAEFQPLEPEP